MRLTGLKPITAWALTTGEAGMRTQARGLALASADDVSEKTVRLATPWRWLPPALVSQPLRRLHPAGDPLAPPWPDLLISCGRRSAPVALAVRRASDGRTLAVHIQDPRLAPEAFDLVVALSHDSLVGGANVLKTLTALHDVTPQGLLQAGALWRDRLAAIGRPMAGVAVGGSMRRRPFRLADARRLATGLSRLRRAGVGLAIVPSRRTPAAVLDLLGEQFAGDERVFVWDRRGENPYLAILALADRLIVTSDSVSMISEALAAGPPVEIFDLGVRRHEPFLDALVAQTLARRFEGDPEPPDPAGPTDATLGVAQTVRILLQARIGSSRKAS